MPAEGRENHLLKKGNSDAFFREKYLTKNTSQMYEEALQSALLSYSGYDNAECADWCGLTRAPLSIELSVP